MFRVPSCESRIQRKAREVMTSDVAHGMIKTHRTNLRPGQVSLRIKATTKEMLMVPTTTPSVQIAVLRRT